MIIQQQIENYIITQPDSKRSDMLELHERILQILPSGKLWFLDGKNEQGKLISNPNIGYGSYLIKYADGTTKEFYRIGISAQYNRNISIYYGNQR